MFCYNCGKELQEDSQFCGNCGTKIREVSPTFVSHTPENQSLLITKEDEPENVLLKATVVIPIEPDAENHGKLTITNKRIRFKSNRFLNADWFGKADMNLSFFYNEIAKIKNTKYDGFFPAIEITTKNGYSITFGGNWKLKKAYEIICDKMKSYT